MITQGIADTVRVRSVDDGESYALTFDVEVEEGRRVRVTWKAGENPTERLTDGQRVRVAGKVTNDEITSPVMIYNQDTKSFVKPFPEIPLLAKIGLVLPVALLLPGAIFILARADLLVTIWYLFTAFVLVAFMGAHAAAIYRLFGTGSAEWFGLTERRIPAELTWSAAFFLGIFIIAIIQKVTVREALFIVPVIMLVASSPVVGVYFALFLVKSDRPRAAKLLWALIAALCVIVVAVTLVLVPRRKDVPIADLTKWRGVKPPVRKFVPAEKLPEEAPEETP